METVHAANSVVKSRLEWFGEVRKDVAELHVRAIERRCVGCDELLGEPLRWDGGTEGRKEEDDGRLGS